MTALQSAPATIVEDVHVFTGTGFELREQFCVRGGSIVPPAPASEVSDHQTPGRGDDTAVVVDARGGYLVPGLIDAHMHVATESDLVQLAHHGVTTGLDMACWPLDRVRHMTTSSAGASLFSAGVPAVAAGGNHARLPGFPPEGIVTSSAQARDFVARRADEGIDYLKVVTEARPPEGMDQPTVDALVVEAHRRGLLVVAHSVTVGAFDVAIRAGVDVSTHAPVDGVLRDDQVEAMRASGMASCPTLVMMTGVAAAREPSGARFEYALRSVTALHSAGVPILAGTDANSAPGVPFAPAQGSSLHRELGLLVDAGLTPLEALRSATVEPAAVFGLDDRGELQYGRRADLVLLRRDPLRDVSAIAEAEGVWVAGARVNGTP